MEVGGGVPSNLLGGRGSRLNKPLHTERSARRTEQAGDGTVGPVRVCCWCHGHMQWPHIAVLLPCAACYTKPTGPNCHRDLKCGWVFEAYIIAGCTLFIILCNISITCCSKHSPYNFAHPTCACVLMNGGFKTD